MRESLLRLIEERTEKVLLAIKLLENKFGSVKPAVANRYGALVPKTGFLDSAKTISYNFHGIGCSVNFGSEDINFDFDFATENHTGFNVWRVAEFLSGRKNQFADLAELDLSKLQMLLDELEVANKIVCVEKNRYSRLYYLKDAPRIAVEQSQAEFVLS